MTIIAAALVDTAAVAPSEQLIGQEDAIVEAVLFELKLFSLQTTITIQPYQSIFTACYPSHSALSGFTYC